MRTSTKVFLYILSVIFLSMVSMGLLLFIRHWKENQNYYPMGGEVLVASKFEIGSITNHGPDNKYYIVIRQGEDSAYPAQFLLSCTKEQFDSVEIGDTVNCERDQSTSTYMGIVHGIKRIN